MDIKLKAFLETASMVRNKNILKEQERRHEEERLFLEKEKKMTSKNQENLTYDENLKSVKRIKELGFDINSYHKQEHHYGSDYYEDMDIFYCSYKDWIFTVEWAADPDIEEGILALREPKNIKTGQKLDFYCDLFCQNTSEKRLNDILTVFEIGYSHFIEQNYGKYIELPNLLEEKGYLVKEENFHFEIGDNKGHIDIGDGAYIRIYRAWRDDVKFVITNNRNWNVNSSNGIDLKKEVGYFFKYNHSEDLEELCKCIEAFKEHLKGHYGYKEIKAVKDENGKTVEKEVYYKNKDFLNIFNKIKSDLKQKYYDKWNNHILHIDRTKIWDARGYGIEPKTINHYKGLEIYETILLKINDSSRPVIGDEIIQYIIHFEYDKRKNDKDCLLHIIQWIGKVPETVITKEMLDVNHPSYFGSYEKYGSFSELTVELNRFLSENLNIYGVRL